MNRTPTLALRITLTLSEMAGIIYVPDFVANRMGIVNCANEQYGRVGRPGDHRDDPAIARHLTDATWENSMVNITKTVLATAEKDGITPCLTLT